MMLKLGNGFHTATWRSDGSRLFLRHGADERTIRERGVTVDGQD